jgi:tRNA-dihydrouridine synthase
MQYYFAPLEGLTDSIYRRLHHRFFPGVDRYYTPFFSPTVHRALTPREARELPPADSVGFACVPQLLTKVPEDFIWMTSVCKDLGYSEVNLNLGCPSGTVTAKGKGSGMLRNLDELDTFLEKIFSESCLPISVKTRIGFQSGEEFAPLLEVYNRYPIRELTIHPRTRKQFYDGDVHMDMFTYALENSKIPLCFNGELRKMEQISAFSKAFPQVEAVMIGRGLVGDPGMLSPGGSDVAALEAFYDELFAVYTDVFGGTRNAMFRLKENWRHLLCKFEGSEKLGKKLRKATDAGEYKAITHEIFRTLPLREEMQPDW